MLIPGRKQIAFSPYCSNILRMFWVGLDFMPQAGDADIDATVERRTIIAFEQVDELIPAQYAVGMLHQQCQQGDFPASERDFLAIFCQAVVVKIEGIRTKII